MSKLRAVELAVEFLRGRDSFAPSAVVELATSIAAFLGEDVQVAAKPAKPVKAKPDAAPAETIAVVEKETVVAEKAAPVKEEPKAPVVAVGGVTQDEIKKAVGDLAKNTAAGGGPKAREILGSFGASNISTLKPEHYAAAKKAIEAVLEAAALEG
jgi:hypothetical protein